MNIDILQLLDRFENSEKKFLKWFKDEQNKKRSLTEDFIKGLLIQYILKENKDLFVYQDARVTYWKNKKNPDQYVDLIITNKQNLNCLKEFEIIWKNWDSYQNDMIVCEIKLSSTTVLERMKNDEIRIGKWHYLYQKRNLRFYFIVFDLDKGNIKKYSGEELYNKHNEIILKELE